MASYLDKAGLTHLWSKLKPLIAGKADSIHTHDAGDITSGTFSTARIPGLGASKITSGTFTVSRGGTGKSSVTAGSYLIGNGTSAMTEKTPAQVLAHIGAAEASHGHDAATSSTAGFMSATDKEKLNSIESGANKYSHPASHPASMITGLATVATSGSYNDLSDQPTIPAAYTHPNYTAKSSGLYKVTVDGTGHVSETAAVAKSDITALGIPAQDTTYSAAGSSLGLVKSGGDVTISGGVITVNDDSHAHTIANVDGLQSALNGKENTGAAATALTNAKSYTDTKISDLINSAPTTLDTLGEIAAAMEENADVVEALESAVGSKANAADLTSHTGNKSNPHGVTAAQVGAVPTTRTVNGKALSSNISLAASDVGAATSSHTHDAATTSAAGFMSATDKSKLDGIATGANKTTVDSALSSSSANPVQNKVVNSALAGKLNASGGTVGGDLTMSNSASAQSGQPKLQWKTVGSNTPFMGFAVDQNDGTFVICSMEKDTTTNGAKNYKNGLAIGGGSGNLFWKGVRVATADDVSSAINNIASITNAEIDAAWA